jgi:hypothetical protein
MVQRCRRSWQLKALNLRRFRKRAIGHHQTHVRETVVYVTKPIHRVPRRLGVEYKRKCLDVTGPGSSVSIANDYGLDCPGIESLPVVECGRSVVLTTHPILAPSLRMSRAIPLLPL